MDSDKDWYKTGVVLAAANVSTIATSLTIQAFAAASSTYTWGFDAGFQLDVKGEKTENSQNSTSSNASTITGENIVLQTGSERAVKILQQ